MKTKIYSFSVIILLFTLVACDGGGGSGGNNPTATNCALGTGTLDNCTLE